MATTASELVAKKGISGNGRNDPEACQVSYQVPDTLTRPALPAPEKVADREPPSSASQPSGDPSFQQDDSALDDYPMMEAPDSPPDAHHPTANQSATLSSAQGANGSRTNSETKANHGAPGSTWNNKKWHDEYERANAQLLDQEWDSTTFGDPLVK